jgi:transcriptional regulator with XRE-family HTH domain
MDVMGGNAELAEFLRTRRARTDPGTVGLSPGPHHRRVPGLRREELARLAGVSADYYARLEQGRHITPSDGVLAALARALRLDDAESAHLFALARRSPAPVRRRAPEQQRVRPGLQQMMAALHDQPAFILGRRTDVLSANPLAKALITDFSAKPAIERNYTRFMVLDPAAKALYPDWEVVAADAVGTLRLDAGRYPDDPRTAELVGELAMKSEPFRTWWADHRVVERSFGTKRFHHRIVGDLDIDYEAMTFPGDADQTLFVYTTRPGSASNEAMRLLASWSAAGSGPTATSARVDPEKHR